MRKLTQNFGALQTQQELAVPGSDKWRLHVSRVAAETGLSGRTGLFEAASKTYTPSGSPPSPRLEANANLDLDQASDQQRDPVNRPGRASASQQLAGELDIDASVSASESSAQASSREKKPQKRKPASKPQSIREEIDKW